MTTVLRVIPNFIYERLLDDGVLEKLYPAEETDKNNQILNKIPPALRDRAKSILAELEKVNNFSWGNDNRIVFNEKPVHSSDIGELVLNLVLQSDKLYQQVGIAQFLTALKVIPSQLYTLPVAKHPTPVPRKSTKKQPTTTSWISFDDRFSIHG
jgi:hypothetical protein